MGLNETELFSGCAGCTGSIRLEAEKIIGDVNLCRISIEDAEKINKLVIWIDRFQGMIESSIAAQNALRLNMMEASQNRRAEIQQRIDSMSRQSDAWKGLYTRHHEQLSTLLQEISAQ